MTSDDDPAGRGQWPEDADRRLHWRSRRGLLELELALAPFVEQRLTDLTGEGKARYARLLEHDDQDIYDWILGRSAPADPDLEPIVEQIRTALRA